MRLLQLKAAFDKILESKKVEATLEQPPDTAVLKQTLTALKENDLNNKLLKALWKAPGKKLKEAFEKGLSTLAIQGLIDKLLTQFLQD